MAASTRSLELAVISAAVTVVVVFIVVSLWRAGVFESKEEVKAYQNVTFTDALLTCQEQTRDLYKGQLKQLVTDNHSSRFEHKEGLYKIFLQAQMQRKDKGPSSKFYVNCYVRSSNGKIAKYDAHEEKELKARAIRKKKETLFGWP